MTDTHTQPDTSAQHDTAVPAPPRRRRSRAAGVLIVLALMLIGAGVVRLMVGERWGWPDSTDVLRIRLDRLWIALIVGASLATAGAVLQGLLRNPLASPYILGVSSGAALGVMVGWVGWLAALGTVQVHIAALGGAMLTLAVVYLLAQKRGRIDPIGLLLVGVIVNAINGAAIMFINYLSPHGQRGQMALWLLGYLNEDAGRDTMLIAGAATLVAIVLAAWLGRALDVATFTDAEAHALGVNLGRLRLAMFALAGVLTAAAVVLAGPIGFVGLICPHIVRLAAGPGHRPLIVGSALAGAALLVGADAAVKVLDVGQGMMPVGVLTAMIGGPIFVILLRPQLGRGYDA